MNNLYYNTVSPLLREALQKLMAHEAFNDYILVGGTSLSLQLGHRESIDIDLFTEKEYGTIDTQKIQNALLELFEYTENINSLNNRNIGYSFHVGNDIKDPKKTVKVDMFYTEPFLKPAVERDGLRLSSLEDIAGMKMQAITSRKRKKDFWDIYELLNYFTFAELIDFGLKRNPYSLDEETILKAFDNLIHIDGFSTINCFKGNYWEIIVADLEQTVLQFLNPNRPQ